VPAPFIVVTVTSPVVAPVGTVTKTNCPVRFLTVVGIRYVSDGDNDSNNPVSVNETVTQGGVWRALTAAPNTVTDSASAVWDAKLFCIGGGSSAVPFQGNVYDYVQIFDATLSAPASSVRR